MPDGRKEWSWKRTNACTGVKHQAYFVPFYHETFALLYLRPRRIKLFLS